MKDEPDNLPNTDIEYRLILLGDTAVGKTCLFKKLTFGVFKDKNVSTIGIDRRTFKVKCDLEEKDGTTNSKIVQINLTDTAGQERYKSLTKSYYKSSDAAIILYDITDKQSFINIDNWIQSINASTSQIDKSTYTIFLMGTKLDLVDSGIKERQVEEDEAQTKCEENNIEWGGECSNKDFTEDQFKEIFAGFVKIIHKKMGNKPKQQESVKLANFKKKKKTAKKFC
jgi:small GTP-binding protein